MSFDPIGQALSALNKLAGNELLHKYGLYQPTQKIAYRATKEGFRAAVAIGRQWKAAQKLLKPERLPTAARKHDLFDLSISEDQQLVRDTAQRFAREMMRDVAAKSNDAAKAPEDFARSLRSWVSRRSRCRRTRGALRRELDRDPGVGREDSP